MCNVLDGRRSLRKVRKKWTVTLDLVSYLVKPIECNLCSYLFELWSSNTIFIVWIISYFIFIDCIVVDKLSTWKVCTRLVLKLLRTSKIEVLIASKLNEYVPDYQDIVIYIDNTGIFVWVWICVWPRDEASKCGIAHLGVAKTEERKDD